jgi:hypothetical protein
MPNDVLSRLAVEYQSVGNLAAFPSNARSHSKHQIRQIAASIEQFGPTTYRRTTKQTSKRKLHPGGRNERTAFTLRL